ncbi:MAG: hypothetical protein DMF61_21165 [Blastocatellia bacterium AA13]|nr:MAG: hypothetical protein DMF61_21165 [Blastocatellia bacterium AA13]
MFEEVYYEPLGAMMQQARPARQQKSRRSCCDPAAANFDCELEDDLDSGAKENQTTSVRSKIIHRVFDIELSFGPD